MVIDGTPIPVDRIAADRPFYSDEHKTHGVDLQVIASPDGTILWGPAPCPAAPAAMPPPESGTQPRSAVLRDTGLIALGDKGCDGFAPTGRHVMTPDKGRDKPGSQKDANRAHGRPRGTGERANTKLKDLACPAQTPPLPRRAGRLAKAMHVLQNYEVDAG